MTTPARFNFVKTVTAAMIAIAITGLAPNHTAAQSGTIPTLTKDELLTRAQFLEDLGAAERINYAGKLRMLSQRIPAAACNVHAEINEAESAPVLQAALLEFDAILAALEFGDESLNIKGAEERRKTLAAIEQMKEHWLPIEEIVAEIAEHNTTADHVQYLADHNMDILADAKLLVSEISGQYADPTALLQSDALRIDIAGRQRMLTQKISKEVCFIASDINADASREVLGNTINMFEVSLNALHHGMPEAGIGAAPNEEIAAQLTKVAEDWALMKPHVESVLAGASLDDETRALVFAGLNKTMVDMNIAVGMFAESSKLGL